MAGGDDSTGDAGGDIILPEQQHLVAIKPRGRPSNWAKKFALHQQQDSHESTNNNNPKTDNQTQAESSKPKARSRKSQTSKSSADQPSKPQPNKSPAVETPEASSIRKSARTQAIKPNGFYSPQPDDSLPATIAPRVLVAPDPSKSRSTAVSPGIEDEDGLPLIRDDDSLFEGDAGSLFGGDDGPETFTRAPSHADSLFVEDEGTEQPRASRSIGPVASRTSPFRGSTPAVQSPKAYAAAPDADRVSPFPELSKVAPEPAGLSAGFGPGSSLSSIDCKPTESHSASLTAGNGYGGSSSGGNHDAAESLLALSGQPAVCRSPFPLVSEAVESQVVSHRRDKAATPRPPASTASERTNISAELHTMASEVRRWEAVTQQVATSTAEMTTLIRDLTSQSFASRPPSRSVSDMLSPEDQARFREQLLRTTQLSLKADLIQTLKERDSETRRLQVYCVVVVAVAVVVAAFLVSPFASWVAEWLEWAVIGG